MTFHVKMKSVNNFKVNYCQKAYVDELNDFTKITNLKVLIWLIALNFVTLKNVNCLSCNTLLC